MAKVRVMDVPLEERTAEQRYIFWMHHHSVGHVTDRELLRELATILSDVLMGVTDVK